MWQNSSAPDRKYLDRKLGEIRVLFKFTSKHRTAWRIKTVEDVVDAKLRLKEQIRAAATVPSAASESNLALPEQRISVFGFELEYIYQRMGLRLATDNQLCAIYKGLDTTSGQLRQMKNLGFFTASCQGAISVLFHSLRKVFGELAVAMPVGAYWETLYFLDAHGIPHGVDYPSGRASRVLFLDSSTEVAHDEPQVERLLRGCRVVIIDTTFYSLDSPRIKAWLELSAHAGVPCILVRSHIKLDCMAMEYGRLGSVVMTVANDASARARVRYEKISDTYRDMGRYYGVFASIRQLYPFYNSKAFHAANGRRVELIRENNALVTEILERSGCFGPKTPFSLARFRHDIFFALSLKSRLTEERFNSLGRTLCRTFGFAQIPFRMVASCPWDFLAMTMVSGTATPKTIRLSIPDFSESQARRAADAIIIWADRAKRELRND